MVEPAALPDEDRPWRVRFGPSLSSLFPVVVAALGVLPLAGTSPWFAALALLPLAAAVWVLRARVVADRQGLQVGNGLALHAVAWDDVEGFDVPRRGPVRLLVRGGDRRTLTALPRRDLPRLLDAGRRAGGDGPVGAPPPSP